MGNAKVEVVEDSVVVDTYHTNKEGYFSFELDFEKTFIIRFTSSGYSAKEILLNTDLPEGKDPLQHQLLYMKLELIKNFGSETDRGILGVVKFSRITKEFAYESKYDANAFLNVQITGIDYYMSSREQKLFKEGELSLLDLDIKEREIQLAKEDFYEYIVEERNEFLGDKSDSLEFKELPVEDSKYAFDTTINHYSRHRMEVVEIIINNKEILRVYHKVKHYWGAVFYFKNYVPVSRTLFQLETHYKKKKEHFFSDTDSSG